MSAYENNLFIFTTIFFTELLSNRFDLKTYHLHREEFRSILSIFSVLWPGNSGQGPTESSWSSSSVSVPTGRSSAPPAFPLPLLRSYKGLTVSDQGKATSILLLSQLPRRLRCRHGLRLKRPVSGSRCGRPL